MLLNKSKQSLENATQLLSTAHKCYTKKQKTAVWDNLPQTACSTIRNMYVHDLISSVHLHYQLKR